MLAQRRFWRRTEPFPHLYATDVFTPEFHEALTAQFREILGRGFGTPGEMGRFTRNMPHSDAYGYDLLPEQDGPLAILYGRALLDLLSRLLGVAVTADVNAALHHHQLGSKDGMIHNDVGIGYFSEQPRPDGVNPMDLRRCGYTDGHLANGATRCHQVVRAVTMIYYLANPPWRPGDGGETGLYRAADADLHRPVAAEHRREAQVEPPRQGQERVQVAQRPARREYDLPPGDSRFVSHRTPSLSRLRETFHKATEL